MEPRHDAQLPLAASLGAEVLTSDLRHLGTLAVVDGESFLIKRAWWQQNVWLNADRIRSVTVGVCVVLNVDQDHLGAGKLVREPLG